MGKGLLFVFFESFEILLKDINHRGHPRDL